MARPRFILSIDGGGIRGVIPARVLAALERRLRGAGLTGPLADYFDLVIGTSTGGILAAGLTVPSPGRGGLPLTAFELEALYVSHGPGIFPEPLFDWWDQARTLLWSHRYNPRPLEAMIRSVVGDDTRLSAARTRLVLTTYDILHRRARFLSNVTPGEIDARVWQAALATAAAPTFLPPVELEELPSPDGTAAPDPKAGKPVLVDGGVFANDPAMAGYVEGLKLRFKAAWEPKTDDDTVVVSLGTGYALEPYTYRSAKGWSALSWIQRDGGSPLISIFMDGQASTASYQLNALLNRRQAKIHKTEGATVPAGPAHQPLFYYRWDDKLPHASMERIDNARADNLRALQAFADGIVAKNGAQMDALVGQLAAAFPP
ncbi:patatin-like phospholipase family protein [Chthonobacter rhizosphaerae]|uniref:patatin-like phospholipase family protein n=1 Tax=Chthonobacter rhizosphaerae TaxID=2735553 RepID=UPI0015EF2E5D|nr:patatin-like phospholipase family protein [Chthonobacter rhizosphaerae]